MLHVPSARSSACYRRRKTYRLRAVRHTAYMYIQLQRRNNVQRRGEKIERESGDEPSSGRTYGRNARMEHDRGHNNTLFRDLFRGHRS